MIMIAILCSIGLLLAGIAAGHYLRSRSIDLPPYVLRDDAAYYLDRNSRRVTTSALCCLWAACLFGVALVLAVLRAWGA